MEQQHIIVAGAGGHALEVLDLLISLNFTSSNISFYDDYNTITEIHLLSNFRILTTKEELRGHLMAVPLFCIGVGAPKMRKMFYNLFTQLGGVLYPLRAPSAIVSPSSFNVFHDVMPLSFVARGITIGKGTLVNVGSKIHHQSKIGEFVELSPASTILGGATVGNFTRIGSGATVLPNITIGEHVTIGAGALVTKDIPDNVIAFGVPATVRRK